MSTALCIFSLFSIVIGIVCAVTSVLTLKANAAYFDKAQAQSKFVSGAATGVARSKVEAELAASEAKGARSRAEDAAKEANGSASRASKHATSAMKFATDAQVRAASVTPTYLQEIHAPMTDPIFHFPKDLERDCE